jgi:hypothetical protein
MLKIIFAFSLPIQNIPKRTFGFVGFEVFNVSDYTAIGDGDTDDLNAFHEAVAAVRAAGGGIIRRT